MPHLSRSFDEWLQLIIHHQLYTIMRRYLLSPSISLTGASSHLPSLVVSSTNCLLSSLSMGEMGCSLLALSSVEALGGTGSGNLGTSESGFKETASGDSE